MTRPPALIRSLTGFFTRHPLGGIFDPLAGICDWQIIVGVLYVAVGMASRSYGYNRPDAVWYVFASQRILDGSLDIWGRADEVWAAPPLGMVLTYPPLVPLLLTPLVALGQALGLSEAGLYVLVGLPMLVFDVLLAHQVAATVGEWTGQRETRWQVVAFLLCLLTFIVPFSSAYMGHHETLVVLFILLAVQAKGLTASGTLWGLALAAKQTAAFAYVPFAFLLLKGFWQERRPSFGELARFALPSLGIPVLLTLPFWIAHPDRARYALFGVESYRELYGLNVPRLLDSLARHFMPAAYGTIHALLIKAASPVYLMLVATMSAVYAWRQRRSLALRSTARAPLLAVMGAAYAAYVVFGKWNDTHYQLMPMMFLLLLDLLERPSFPYVYVLFTFAVMQYYVFVEPVSTYWRFLLYVGLLVYFLYKTWARPADSSQARRESTPYVSETGPSSESDRP